MKKMTLLIVFATLAFQGLGQNQNKEYRFVIKINNLTSFEKFQMVNSWDEMETASESYYDYSNLTILNPTISIQLTTKNKNLHEIELINFSLGSNEFKESYYHDLYETVIPRRGSVQSKTNLSVKYEYIYTFNKAKENRFVPSIGLGVNPQYLSLISEPIIAYDWRTDNKLFIFRFQITPRISYFISERAFIDLSIPLTFADFKYNIYHIDNPIISHELRTSKTNEFNILPVYYGGRVGVGLLF